MTGLWTLFWALLGYQKRPLPPRPAPPEDALQRVVAQTGVLVAQEAEHLLATIRHDPQTQHLHMVPLLLRGTSTTALDALANNSPAQALAPLARLAGGAWLALILLSLDAVADPSPAASPPR